MNHRYHDPEGSDAHRRSILISIRQKQSVYDDPFYDGWPVLCGHWRFASVGGNRERSCAGVYVVEMYVSFKIFFLVLKFQSRQRVTIPIAGERDGKTREKKGKIVEK